MVYDSQSDNDRISSMNNTTLDERAFKVFFKENFTALCGFCQYKFGFDITIAKEAVHTAFIRLWENRGTVSPVLSLKAYMYKIVINISLDILKHRKVKEQHEMYVVQNTPASLYNHDYESADFKELKNDIDNAVSELPEQMRKVFELSRYEGLKYIEIANHLGISVKTVETQMSRALVKLRQKLAIYLPLYFLILSF